LLKPVDSEQLQDVLVGWMQTKDPAALKAFGSPPSSCSRKDFVTGRVFRWQH